MSKYLAYLILFGVTIIWGLAFVWQSVASKFLGALWVVGIRSLIAVIFLILISVLMPTLYKSQEPKLKIKDSKKKTYFVMTLCGVVIFLAMYIQQIGLEKTTASKAGFITVLYICFVPLIGIFLGHKVNKYFVLGLFLSIIGFYLLSVKGEFSLEFGDLLVLISSVFFGIHILIIDYASVRVNSMFLSIFQLIVVSVLSFIVAIIKEPIIFENVINAIMPLLALGILSSGVGYTLQIISQRHIPPHTTSLIMSLESVVAAIGGVFILGEVLSTKETIGMIIVFVGIILSQKETKKKKKN